MGEIYMQSNINTNKGFFSNLSGLYERFIYGETKSEDDKVLENLRKAHTEWKQAESYFENVTDPDLVDHAIYQIEAARTKYTYLLRIAREMHIHVDFT